MSVNGIEATVALCKYRKFHKVYGVRFERAGRKFWEYTWAFPMQETAAKRESYDETTIVGDKRIIPAVHTAARISL